jgi:uncharacterized RDD family membrane protein YckC
MSDEYTKDLKELFADLEDTELIERKNSGNLTEIAQQLIEAEISNRGITKEGESRLLEQEQKLVERINAEVSMYPGVFDRGVAHLIDQFMLLPIGFFAAVLADLLFGEASSANGIWVVPCLLYFLFSDALPNGQSIGKKICKISVVSYDKRQPSGMFDSFVRNIVLLLAGVVDIFFLFSKERRRLGDRAAGTIVVWTKDIGKLPNNSNAELRSSVSA